jgi:hypothetical protein
VQKVILSTLSIVILSITSLPAHAGKPQSLINFEAQADEACSENPKAGRLVIRPFLKSIDNFALTKIYCRKIVRSVSIDPSKNPNLINSIEVLGETLGNTIVSGVTHKGVKYEVNLLEE